MADGAVLAHHVAIGEGDAGAGAIVWRLIGTADEIDDLIGFDRAGARIHRIGADRRQIVDLEGEDVALPVDGDAALAAMVAGVNVGEKALDAVGDVFDGTAQHPGERGGRHLVGIDVNLDAERAAHVLADDAHLGFLEAEMLGDDVLHHVRRLRALIDGQALFARIPVGEHGARLQRNAGVAAEHEFRLRDRVGARERGFDIARVELALEGEVVAEVGMDRRGVRRQRRLHVGDDGQFLVAHLDQSRRVLGFGARRGRHRRDGLAHPARAVHGDGVLRRGFEALHVRQHTDPGRADLGQLGACHHGDDARRRSRGARVDAGNARMGVGRAHEGDVNHARQRHVADV